MVDALPRTFISPDLCDRRLGDDGGPIDCVHRSIIDYDSIGGQERPMYRSDLPDGWGALLFLAIEEDLYIDSGV